ncbi:hypothetical protein [Dactylosporangium sp. NPDC048998]|uniref:hypothetical protein n=1 Tax=Dactylosporangium sp. NPDC048998 TaxID=3363976 RepID=UPI00371E5D67
MVFVRSPLLIGFAGNELVARHHIRVGRRIGSAALVAVLHFTSSARAAWRSADAGPIRWSACSSRSRSCSF